VVLLLFTIRGLAGQAPFEATQRGRTFLVSLLDTNLDLLPEYRGANVYWLFHDNYLASRVLAISYPKVSQQIIAAIHREGVYKSGRIQSVFGEIVEPLPFHEHQSKDLRSLSNKVIRTEVATSQLFAGWENYADLLFLACFTEKNPQAAHRYWEAAMRMWDGNGFMDEAAKHEHLYSTYKLGLALLAAKRLSPPVEPPPGTFDKLLALQNESGGWVTHYDSTGKKFGDANVETTSLAILGLEATAGQGPKPSK
jgi:hypothetical protein